MRPLTNRPRVLVVDDAPAVAERLREWLQDEVDGDIVGPALSGSEGLELFRAFAPDIALVDLRMPGLDGLGLLRAIRESGQPCTVVILTNQAEPALRDECLAQGADHFLRKSHDLDRIVEIVRAHREGG